MEIQDAVNLLAKADWLPVTWNNDEDIFFIEYVDLLIRLENIEKPSIVILFSVTNDTKNCPMTGFNAVKKNLDDLKVLELVFSSLQNSLHTDTAKTTPMIKRYHNDQFL